MRYVNVSELGTEPIEIEREIMNRREGGRWRLISTYVLEGTVWGVFEWLDQ